MAVGVGVRAMPALGEIEHIANTKDHFDQAVIELSAPDGQQDDTYVIAVFVDGRRLVIVEAAGEVGWYIGRREAVVAAIKGLTF